MGAKERAMVKRSDPAKTVRLLEEAIRGRQGRQVHFKVKRKHVILCGLKCDGRTMFEFMVRNGLTFWKTVRPVIQLPIQNPENYCKKCLSELIKLGVDPWSEY